MGWVIRVGLGRADARPEGLDARAAFLHRGLRSALQDLGRRARARLARGPDLGCGGGVARRGVSAFTAAGDQTRVCNRANASSLSGFASPGWFSPAACCPTLPFATSSSALPQCSRKMSGSAASSGESSSDGSDGGVCGPDLRAAAQSARATARVQQPRAAHCQAASRRTAPSTWMAVWGVSTTGQAARVSEVNGGDSQ